MMLYWTLALVLPALVGSTPSFIRLLPQDCNEILRSGETRSGVYTIYPSNDTPAQVYCDMGCTEDNQRGWTVIQRRMDGSVNFYRNWEQYRNGFGNTSSEYWLGLENLFEMTQNKLYMLRVDLEGFDGIKVFAEYTRFIVGPEGTDYTLQVDGFVDGGAGDSLSYHNGVRFSTFDHDSSPYSCATQLLSGFWHNACILTNANGIYLWRVDYSNYGRGVCWYTWRGLEYNIKTYTMKIRPAF